MLVRLLDYFFLLLIFSIPFVQPANLPVSTSFVQITDIIFLIAAGFFAILVLIKKLSFRFDFFYSILIFYLVGLSVSAIFSVNQQQSFVKLLGEIYLIGLCVLTFNLVCTMEMFKKTVFVWLAAMTIVSLIGILTVVLFYIAPDNALLSITLHHYGTLIPGNYPRIQATFYYPSMLCHYFSIGLPLLFISLKNQWISRTIFYLIFSVTLSSLFFTLTPGLGGVCLSIGLWFWLIYFAKARFWAARFSLLAGIFLSAGFFLVALVSPIQTPTSPYYVTVPVVEKRIDPSVRVLTWQSSLETFLKNPISGRGVGTDAANVLYKDASGRTQNLRDAHQIWLNVAAESGILGLTAIILIGVFIWRKCLPFAFDLTAKNVVKNGLATAFISAFLIQGLVGSFEDARHLWVLFGLILASDKFNSSL